MNSWIRAGLPTIHGQNSNKFAMNFSTDEMSSIDQILSITAARNPSETFEN